jgi:nucleotide-binding universal stress UspA family protein
VLPISRILAPVDFSERSLSSLAYIKAIATKYDADVTLLHVVDSFYTVPATGISGPVLVPVPPSVVSEREEKMRTFARAELNGVKVQRVIFQGDPVAQIISYAQTNDISLIGMPTHGYGVLRRFLIGSVTSKVLHDAACPVLTDVHSENRSDSRSARFSKILCAIDLGPQSQDVLSWAARLASDYEAKLEIVHAIAGLPNAASTALRMELEAAARGVVEKMQAAAKAQSASVHFRTDEPPEAVSSLASSSGTGLVVIGRGQPDEKGGRLPRNAYAIIRRSPCPVISV